MATSGEEALQVIERNAESIQLLLTDVTMPRLSGWELSAPIAAIRPDIKVVYMSGFTRDPRVLKSSQDTSLGFVAKPFTAVALTRKIRDVLDGASRPA